MRERNFSHSAAIQQPFSSHSAAIQQPFSSRYNSEQDCMEALIAMFERWGLLMRINLMGRD